MIASAQVVVFVAFYLVIFGLSAWALIDLLRRPAAAFSQAGKRTKRFWGTILAVATVVSFSVIPVPGVPHLPSFLALLAAVGAIVYLVDVKPAVTPYSRRRGPRGPRGGGSGGW
ncbi:DUF2516 family protein [Cellulomonas fengjieae]|uniref:DUF2516 family protein n=1 Tax=Cellulomonas fengjieae TaxID=2819978 RepID=UPI0020C08845|nr:DUF2516 family protein [Cellulomonas fengjieae]